MKKVTGLFAGLLVFINPSSLYAETAYLENVDPMTDMVSYYAVITGDKGQITFACAPNGNTVLSISGLPFNPFEKKGTMRGFKVRFDKEKLTGIVPAYRDGAFLMDSLFDDGKQLVDFLYKVVRHKKLLIDSKKGIHTYNLVGADKVVNKVLLKCKIHIEPPRADTDVCKKNSKGEWKGPYSTIEISSKETCEFLNRPSANFKEN